MQVEQDVDAVEWMRARWAEHGEPSPSHFAAMASVMRAAAVMSEAVEQRLKKLNLNRTGYLVLITLQMAPNNERPLGQLSRQLLVHPTTVTLLVDQLEKPKLVTRLAHPTDRRTVLARLTPKGLKVTQEASASLAEIGFGVGDIDAATADRIVADLRTMRRSIGDLR